MSCDSVCVIGLGYIGLPTAAILASRKKTVIGVDISAQTVDVINRGHIHIVEPDLDMIVHATVAQGWLRATTVPEPADAFIIAVPTPFRDGNKPDISAIKAASRAIAPVLKKGDLIILESTSPVGTTEAMAGWLSQARPDLTFPPDEGENSDIRIAHCPERVLPGQILRELVHNDRIVGGMTEKCSQAAIGLYNLFVEGDCRVTDMRTAEMCKLTENSFRDVNIAFANELSMICDQLGIDVWELIGMANCHPRTQILKPSAGVGGHCIAVDPWFMVAAAPDHARLIRTAREVNDYKPYWVLEKIEEALGAFLVEHPDRTASDVTVACLGLSFKPDIDDMRQSPALVIVRELAPRLKGRLLIVEPHIRQLPDCLAAASLVDTRSAIEQADIVVLLVAHRAFSSVADRIRPGQLFFAFSGDETSNSRKSVNRFCCSGRTDSAGHKHDRVERVPQ